MKRTITYYPDTTTVFASMKNGIIEGLSPYFEFQIDGNCIKMCLSSEISLEIFCGFFGTQPDNTRTSNDYVAYFGLKTKTGLFRNKEYDPTKRVQGLNHIIDEVNSLRNKFGNHKPTQSSFKNKLHEPIWLHVCATYKNVTIIGLAESFEIVLPSKDIIRVCFNPIHCELDTHWGGIQICRNGEFSYFYTIDSMIMAIENSYLKYVRGG